MLDELKARLGLDENTENFNPEDEPEVRLAKASADLAAANLQRAKDLIAKKVISTEAFDQTQTEYELAAQRYRQALFQIKQAYQVCRTAQIKLAILKKAVDDTTIRAPFDGWVAEKLVAVGEQISSGMQATKVVTLVRIDPLRLLLTVPQQDIGRIQPGQTVRFHVDSFPDRVFEAQVRLIAPVVTNDTRSMMVEAMAKNPDGALRPGLFATAELELKDQGTAVLAPLGAVQKTGEVARVFVVRDGGAREQVVALGEPTGGKVEIRSGLTGKEILVARPELVHDGDKVRGHEPTGGNLRQAARLRHRADPGAGGVRRLRLPEARAGPVSRRSTFPMVTVTTSAAGVCARRHRDADHRQDRGGSQHDQRHRGVAFDLVGGHFAGLSCSSCWRRTATWRRRTCATR